jgi:hypothetical protein
MRVKTAKNRRKNVVSPGSKTLNGMRVTSNGVRAALADWHNMLA